MKIAITHYRNITLSKGIFLSLAALTLGMFLAYVYLINATVWQVAARQEAERSLANRIAEVSATESSYIALSSKITMDNAYQLGFQKTSDKNITFVHEQGALGVASRNLAH